jgi:hypothetical protein
LAVSISQFGYDGQKIVVTILVTIVVGFLTAGATIIAAIIVAHTPKREIHEVVFRGFTAPEKHSPFARIIRGAGIVVVWLLVFIGLNLLASSAFLWLDPSVDPGIAAPEKKLIIAFCFVSSALLFCISRWLYKRLPAAPRSDDEDDDDDD